MGMFELGLLSWRYLGNFRNWHEMVMTWLSPHVRCWEMNGSLGCQASR